MSNINTAPVEETIKAFWHTEDSGEFLRQLTDLTNQVKPNQDFIKENTEAQVGMRTIIWAQDVMTTIVCLIIKDDKVVIRQKIVTS